MQQRRHTPEQIILKLREAERLRAEGADIGAWSVRATEWRKATAALQADQSKRAPRRPTGQSRGVCWVPSPTWVGHGALPARRVHGRATCWRSHPSSRLPSRVAGYDDPVHDPRPD